MVPDAWDGVLWGVVCVGVAQGNDGLMSEWECGGERSTAYGKDSDARGWVGECDCGGERSTAYGKDSVARWWVGECDCGGERNALRGREGGGGGVKQRRCERREAHSQAGVPRGGQKKGSEDAKKRPERNRKTETHIRGATSGCRSHRPRPGKKFRPPEGITHRNKRTWKEGRAVSNVHATY
jgi:hypothetical protein